MRILVIDDEPINHQLVSKALENLDCQILSAENGTSGIAYARSLKPDIIITDVIMPDINGYEVTRLLRREAQFFSTPIIVLTAQAGLKDKLHAFEVGADDYLSKPFEPAELAARISVLMRRLEIPATTTVAQQTTNLAKTIAVHSLRGGTGGSMLAVNLGLSLNNLWSNTILLDLTMTAGQVALMLNKNLGRTWADVSHYRQGEVDFDVLKSIIGIHDSGLSFISAPTFPDEGELLRNETLLSILTMLKERFQYIIADMPHDFGDTSLCILDSSDVILLVGTPDMASVRAMAAALNAYTKLGYPVEKILPVFNAPFPRSSLSKGKIETALGVEFIAAFPYVADHVVESINLGRPLVLDKPQELISSLLEDFAFYISRAEHKKSKPERPTEAWNRVYKRFQSKRK